MGAGKRAESGGQYIQEGRPEPGTALHEGPTAARETLAGQDPKSVRKGGKKSVDREKGMDPQSAERC